MCKKGVFLDNTMQNEANGLSEREFLALVDDYYHAVLSKSWSATRNTPDAEDLTQDIFILAWLGRQGFRGDATASTWLYAITKYAVRSFLRKTRRDRARLCYIANSLARLKEIKGFEDIFAEIEEIRGIKNDSMRNVYISHKMEGKTFEEISRDEKLSLATVKRRYYGAVAVLNRRRGGDII